MIEKKAYSWFLCVLLISFLLFPLRTTAGRVILLQTEGGSGNRGNDGNKMGVHGSHSNPAHSRIDHSSPSGATQQSNRPRINVSKSDSAVTAACGARQPYTHCRPSSTRSRSCSDVYDRNCIKT